MLLICALFLITAVQSRDLTAILYEYTDSYDLIWNDKGSGGDHDVSIWRPRTTGGYCSLGDVAVRGYNSPSSKAILVSSKDNQALKPPTGFTEIWEDNWSGSNWDGAVYRMNAPSGYTCLGNVAIRSHDNPPTKTGYCCVKNDYIVRGEFAWTYNDKGSGAFYDFSCWTVKKVSNSLGLAGGNFLSVNGYSNHGLAGYLLEGDGVKVVDASLGIKETFISNVRYNLAHENKITRPISAGRIDIENNSDNEQSASRTLSYEESTSSTYTFNHAVAVGLSVEIGGGVPLIAGAKTTVSASYTFTYETGKTKSSSTTHGVRATVTLPPRKKITATLVATEYKADIPFTATVKTVHYDGSTKEESITGVYKGVAVANFKVTYGKFENIN